MGIGSSQSANEPLDIRPCRPLCWTTGPSTGPPWSASCCSGGATTCRCSYGQDTLGWGSVLHDGRLHASWRFERDRKAGTATLRITIVLVDVDAS
jgi:hypothetical protein